MSRVLRLRVTIDRLAMQGARPEEAAALRRALEAELAARLGAPEALEGRDLPQISVQAPSAGTAGGAASAGRAVGSAIARALGGGQGGKKQAGG